MLRNVSSECLEAAGLESAYAVIPSPSPAELMAKRVFDSLPRTKGAGKLPPVPRPKPPKRQTPRFIITPSIEEWIRKTILSWPHPEMDWGAVRDAVKKKYPAGVWKRQSLARHEVIQDAFRNTKVRLPAEEAKRKDEERNRMSGKAPKLVKPKSGSDEFMQDNIRFLEGRVQQLEGENGILKKQFIRWQRNAFAAGLSLEILDRPLRPTDRGQANE
jgi:hypothetical protein